MVHTRKLPDVDVDAFSRRYLKKTVVQQSLFLVAQPLLVGIPFRDVFIAQSVPAHKQGVVALQKGKGNVVAEFVVVEFQQRRDPKAINAHWQADRKSTRLNSSHVR